MSKLAYGLLLATALVTPALAVTSAPVWSIDNELELDASALGTWCVANQPKPLVDVKKTRVYERNQNCYNRFWIVIGPKGYSTSDRECRMIGTARAEYHKNLMVQYQCTSYENSKSWIEYAEFGFYNTNHLYIVRN